MQPNYMMMWLDLKDAIKDLVCEGDIIHLSDLERVMDEIELDNKD